MENPTGFKEQHHKLGSTQYNWLLQNVFQDLCSLIKKDDLALGIFYPVLWSSNRHAVLVYFFRKTSEVIQKLSLGFFQLCVTFPGKSSFILGSQKKKNAIGKRMLPVPREDKVDLILNTGGPKSWCGTC